MWILILFVHAGFMSNGDSMSITAVPGFATEAGCNAAGQKTKGLVGGTVKNLEFVCVEGNK